MDRLEVKDIEGIGWINKVVIEYCDDAAITKPGALILIEHVHGLTRVD
jgi:hypothetical protein